MLSGNSKGPGGTDRLLEIGVKLILVNTKA